MQKRGHEHREHHMFEEDKLLIEVQIERMKLNRERATLILYFGILVYFAFMIMSLIGYVNQYISTALLNIIIIGGIIILIIAVFPYTRVMKTEEDTINEIMHSLTRK